MGSTVDTISFERACMYCRLGICFFWRKCDRILNEYFAIGLRAGILALFMDFGFGRRQIVSDESKKLTDGKWHEVRVARIGIDM